jgi:hypothetical protein
MLPPDWGRDVSIDFGRIGAKGRTPNQLVAFFNSCVQGPDKMVRAFKENPTGVTVRAVAGITIPSLILYSFNRKNPQYKELPSWRKDLFWNIPLGKRFLSVPKPFELGIIFGSLPERICEWVDTQNPGAFDDFASDLWQTLTPNVLPTALQPIVEVIANKSLFTGKPIVSEGRQRLEPSEQYGTYTSETMKRLGGATGISPAKLEHLYTGYTAGLGRIPLSATDKFLFNPPTRPSEVSNVPLLRGMITREPTGFGSKSVTDFYDLKDKVNKAFATFKVLDEGKKKAFIQNHQNEFRQFTELDKNGNEVKVSLNTLINRKADDLSDLRKTREKILNSSLPIDEKKKRFESIDQRVLDLTRNFMAKLNNERR